MCCSQVQHSAQWGQVTQHRIKFITKPLLLRVAPYNKAVLRWEGLSCYVVILLFTVLYWYLKLSKGSECLFYHSILMIVFDRCHGALIFTFVDISSHRSVVALIHSCDTITELWSKRNKTDRQHHKQIQPTSLNQTS